MPWELTVQHPNGHRLGSPKEVTAALSRVWPELQWETLEPPSPPMTVGILEDDSFSFEVHGFDADPVEDFYLDIRGNGDPTPLLMQLKTQAGLSIKELATGRLLDERQLRERWANYRQLSDASPAQ